MKSLDQAISPGTPAWGRLANSMYLWCALRTGITTVAIGATLLFACNVMAALNFPPLTGRVVDDAGLLSQEARTYLTKLLAEHEQKTGNQVVVVTLRGLQDMPIEDYGYQLGRHWGIGQKERNNGALLIVAPKERKVRIEVGYGLEGTLTDALSRDIIEARMTPQFRQGDYEKGIVAGAQAVLAILEGEGVALERPIDSPQAPSGIGGSVFTVGFFLLMFSQFLSAIFRSRTFASIAIAIIAFLVGVFLFNFVVGLIMALVLGFLNLSMNGRGGGFPRAGGFGGGGFSRGGSRSGGFSGGGGSFGGGGASGSW